MRDYTDQQILFIKTHKEKGATWEEILELYNKFFGETKTIDGLRKGFVRYADEVDDTNVVVKNLKAAHQARKAKAEAEKEKRLLLDELAIYEQFTQDIIAINKSCPIKLHPLKFGTKSKKSPKITRTVIGHISDTHIGVVINKEEMGGINEFNPLIASRRFAAFFKQLAEFKTHRRAETELLLVLNGDIFAGIIHNQEWGVLPMASQHALSLRILSQGISYCRQHYRKVKIVCTSGNHGRFMHKGNQGRQMQQKWDGFDMMLYSSLEEIFKSDPNVTFEIPKTPFALIEVQGHKFLCTHGDTFLNVGNVSRSINVENISKQINNMIIGLGHIDAVLVGHVHKNTVQTLDNGTELLINNTLSGLDPFAMSLGITSNNPSQQIIEVTSEHAVGDVRVVKLKKADKDKSLDSIIEPLNIKID